MDESGYSESIPIVKAVPIDDIEVQQISYGSAGIDSQNDGEASWVSHWEGEVDANTNLPTMFFVWAGTTIIAALYLVLVAYAAIHWESKETSESGEALRLTTFAKTMEHLHNLRNDLYG
jgi:hypothetical protein